MYRVTQIIDTETRLCRVTQEVKRLWLLTFSKSFMWFVRCLVLIKSNRWIMRQFYLVLVDRDQASRLVSLCMSVALCMSVSICLCVARLEVESRLVSAQKALMMQEESMRHSDRQRKETLDKTNSLEWTLSVLESDKQRLLVMITWHASHSVVIYDYLFCVIC